MATPRFWLGVAVTAAFVGLLLLRIDYGEMVDALARANYAWLIPAVIVYFFSFAMRSIRWRFLLRPFHPQVRATRLFPVILIGYMANNLLPMRLGELVRGYFLSTREPVRGSTAFATIVAERAFDGFTLLLLLAAAAAYISVDDLLAFASGALGLPKALIAVGVVIPYALAIAFIVLVSMAPDSAKRLARSVVKLLPARVSGRAYDQLERFINGFEGLHRPTRLLALLLLSLPVWFAELAVYYIVALGFGLQDHFDSLAAMFAALALMAAMSNLATALPSSQGAVGPFEFFAVLSLEALGVGVGLATAYAVVLHLAVLLPPIAVGLGYLAVRGIAFGQLTGRRRTAEGEQAAARERER
ncbi:MAG: flippase-like domain-containing protein [Dehalococcoidia bacterium]|nr:flippase-like domain-containing protein [Dehalococcoidia bacterium]